MTLRPPPEARQDRRPPPPTLLARSGPAALRVDWVCLADTACREGELVQ